MKTGNHKVNSFLKESLEAALAQTAAEIRNKDEMKRFFEDLLTTSEYESISKRFAIAYWLKNGRSWENIKNNLKVSSATIAKVQKKMDKKGLSKALERAQADEWANVWAKRIRKLVK